MIGQQIIWQDTLALDGSDWFRAIVPYDDDNFLISGTGDIGGNYDGIIRKFGNDGTLKWSLSYGGVLHDRFHDMIETSDNCYVIVGETEIDALSDNHDLWVIKVDSIGNEIWSKTYGDTLFDVGYSVKELSDGYIIAGSHEDLNVDMWLLHLDNNGDLMWSRTFGGPDSENAYDVEIAVDGGFILTGTTYSFGNGISDIWVMKTNVDGDSLWSVTLGGADRELATDAVISSNGGILVCGYTKSFGSGNHDAWLIKIDSNGDSLWSVLYGGEDVDRFYKVLTDVDDNTIVTGWTRSYGSGNYDLLLNKYDQLGELQWDYFYGDENTQLGLSILKNSALNYLLLGSYSYSNSPTGDDTYLLYIQNPDLTPKVLSVYPTQNALNVRQDTDISVTFETDIDYTTINSNTFVVHSSLTGLHAGIYSYDAGTKTATLNLNNEFAVGENVSVTLTGGIHNNDGYSIIPFQWSFTIESKIAAGTFTERSIVDIAGPSSCLFSGDIDNDNDIDIVVAISDSDRVQLLLNQGDGSYIQSEEYIVGSNPTYVSCADFNNDNLLDIVTTNLYSYDVTVLINSGNGIFSNSVNYDVGESPRFSAIGDINSDGFNDIISSGSDSLTILINNGSGVFNSKRQIGVNGWPFAHSLGDIDLDGLLDIIVSDPGSTDIYVIRNLGNLNFSNPQNWDVGIRTRFNTSCDIDGDHDLDIIAAGMSDEKIVIILNNEGVFDIHFYLETHGYTYMLTTADLDGDSFPDIISSRVDSNTIYIYYNQGNGNFDSNPTVVRKNSNQYGWINTIDMDGDNDLDLVVTERYTPIISIWYNDDVFSVSITNNLYNEVSDLVQFHYTITNPTNSNSSLQCEYSIDNGSSWSLASIVGDTANIQPSFYSGQFEWNSYTDLPGVDLNTVRFKITPYDQDDLGYADSIEAFHLDNNRVPIVELAPISGEMRADIEISYQLADQEIDTLDLFCEYYDFSIESWQSAVVSGDTTDLSNYSGQVIWNSQDDLQTAYGEQLFRVTPYDNDQGIADTISIFIDQLGLPVAVSISQYLTEQSGDITVAFSLSDDENDTIDILLEYSIDSCNNWSTATVTGLTTDLLPAQYSGSVIWNSFSDLSGVDKSTIKLKLTPNDGNNGFPIETNTFHLDNNQPPNISSIICPDSIAVVTELSFTLVDPENDTLSLNIEYSIDQGQTWGGGLTGGELSLITPENYSQSFDWYTYQSIGFNRLQDAWLKFAVFDNDPGSDTTIKNITIINYPAEFTGDLEINPDDLVIFATAWNSNPQDTTYDIGPSIGIVPELTPIPDGVLDFEDLAVFIQMWNWSFEHNGFGNARKLARASTVIPTNISFDINTPVDKWSSNGTTSIEIHSDQNDLLQVEWIIENVSSDLSVIVVEGDYFQDRYQATPFLTQSNTDSSARLYCVTGLGQTDNISVSNNIAEIEITNRSSSLQPVTVSYRAWDKSGDIIDAGKIDLNIESFLPEEFSLLQNYPNPFNPNTTIRYTLPKQTKVSLSIYNIRGELVNTILSKTIEAGYHQVIWNGDNALGKSVSTGMYFYRISTPGYSETRKMILLK